jgi:hypothetical protein
VDPKLLWPLFHHVERRGVRLPRGASDRREEARLSTLASILHLAADRDPARTAAEARRLSKGASAHLRKSLRLAINRCKQVPVPGTLLQAFYKRPKEFGPRAVSVLRAQELLEHVLSDGLNGYFSNLGQHWDQAAAGLRLVGSERPQAILERAAAVVGEYGSLKDAKSALDATLKMDEAGDQRLESLHRRLRKHLDRVGRAIEGYMERHPTEFTTRRRRE